MDRRIFSKRYLRFLSVFVFAGALLLASGPGKIVMAQGLDEVEELEATYEVVEPVMGPFEEFPEWQVSAAEREQAYIRLLELREKLAMEAYQELEGPVAGPGDAPDVPAAVIGDLSKAPDTLYWLNRRNTRATAVSSTLAEPAAANQGRYAMYQGNTYASYSTDNAVTWVNRPLETGPSDAPIPWCDPDVVYHEGTDTVFRSMLYKNATETTAVLRIWVHNTANEPPKCAYDYRPGAGIVPDYPHIDVSNDFLWLTTNNLSGGSWLASTMKKHSIEEMSKCQSTTIWTWSRTTGGQRVFVPVSGATQTMYWGAIESTNTFRIYWWNESSNSIYNTLKSIATRTYANSDCRGGVGNYDFIEKATSWTMTGFRLRGAIGRGEKGESYVAFYWNAAPQSGRTYAYTASAVFRESDLALINEPDIFFFDGCCGYAAVGSNARGDIGMSLALGGGNWGTAAEGFIGLDDDYTTGPGKFYVVYKTAAGTHNRTDDRFGDYFTVRPHSPDGLAFTATNYSLLNGNTSSAHVNARYIQFVRGHYANGYVQWRFRNPKP